MLTVFSPDAAATSSAFEAPDLFAEAGAVGSCLTGCTGTPFSSRCCSFLFSLLTFSAFFSLFSSPSVSPLTFASRAAILLSFLWSSSILSFFCWSVSSCFEPRSRSSSCWTLLSSSSFFLACSANSFLYSSSFFNFLRKFIISVKYCWLFSIGCLISWVCSGPAASVLSGGLDGSPDGYFSGLGILLGVPEGALLRVLGAGLLFCCCSCCYSDAFICCRCTCSSSYSFNYSCRSFISASNRD